MKKTNIHFTVELDDENIPEQIEWSADDISEEGTAHTKAISLSLWDPQSKNTLRIDLWTKEMPVDEMKRFVIDCLGGLGQSVLSATGDEYMKNEINALCDRLVEHVKKEENQ